MNNWYKFKFSFKIKIHSMRKTRFFFSKYFQAILIDVRIYMYKSNTCMYIYIYKIWIKSVVEPFHTGANQSFSAWISSETKKCISRARTIAFILYSIYQGYCFLAFFSRTLMRLSLFIVSPLYSKIHYSRTFNKISWIKAIVRAKEKLDFRWIS